MHRRRRQRRGWGTNGSEQCAVVEPQPETDYINGYPVCKDPSSDPDGDGWGWENNHFSTSPTFMEIS